MLIKYYDRIDESRQQPLQPLEEGLWAKLKIPWHIYKAVRLSNEVEEVLKEIKQIASKEVYTKLNNTAHRRIDIYSEHAKGMSKSKAMKKEAEVMAPRVRKEIEAILGMLKSEKEKIEREKKNESYQQPLEEASDYAKAKEKLRQQYTGQKHELEQKYGKSGISHKKFTVMGAKFTYKKLGRIARIKDLVKEKPQWYKNNMEAYHEYVSHAGMNDPFVKIDREYPDTKAKFVRQAKWKRRFKAEEAMYDKLTAEVAKSKSGRSREEAKIRSSYERDVAALRKKHGIKEAML